MRTLTTIGLFALGFLFISPAAHAMCNLSFGTVPQFQWQGGGSGYNPFDITTYNQEGRIDVRNCPSSYKMEQMAA